CVGGGGGGGVAGGGGAQDPGQDPGAGGPGFNPGMIDAARYVELKGSTATLGSRNPLRYDPLPGSTITVTSGGQIISQAVTGQDGIYYARLLRGQDNSIRASRPGYKFERDVYHRTPNGPEILEFLAKPL